MEKAYFNWSSGKDSALALYRAVMSGLYDVRALFSVVKTDGRLAMHEVGEALLRRQADAIGIPFHPFHIDTSWTDAEYAACMSKAVGRFKAQGIATALFGDLYLDGLRRWREANCCQDGIRAEFPLWHVEPMDAVNEFIRLGFKAVITCVDCSVLDESFFGRTINERLHFRPFCWYGCLRRARRIPFVCLRRAVIPPSCRFQGEGQVLP